MDFVWNRLIDEDWCFFAFFKIIVILKLLCLCVVCFILQTPEQFKYFYSKVIFNDIWIGFGATAPCWTSKQVFFIFFYFNESRNTKSWGSRWVWIWGLRAQLYCFWNWVDGFILDWSAFKWHKTRLVDKLRTNLVKYSETGYVMYWQPVVGVPCLLPSGDDPARIRWSFHTETEFQAELSLCALCLIFSQGRKEFLRAPQ